jgi:hypothetical protein
VASVRPQTWNVIKVALKFLTIGLRVFTDQMCIAVRYVKLSARHSMPHGISHFIKEFNSSLMLFCEIARHDGVGSSLADKRGPFPQGQIYFRMEGECYA